MPSKENEPTMKRSCQCVWLCSRKLEKEFTFVFMWLGVGLILAGSRRLRMEFGGVLGWSYMLDVHYTKCEVTATRLAQSRWLVNILNPCCESNTCHALDWRRTPHFINLCNSLLTVDIRIYTHTVHEKYKLINCILMTSPYCWPLSGIYVYVVLRTALLVLLIGYSCPWRKIRWLLLLV